MIKIIIILTTLLYSVFAISSDSKQDIEKEFKYKNQPYTIVVEQGSVKGESTDILYVKDKAEKSIMMYKPSDASYLVDSEVINLPGYDKPLLMTKWNHGANHVVLRIFDPMLGDDALLKEVMSRSSVRYEAQEEKIIIEFTQDDYDNENKPKLKSKVKQSSLNLKEFREIWRPKKK